MSAAATIYITLSASSPTIRLSGSDEDDPFYLITTATIKSSTNPSSPITLHTGRYPVAVTALATHAPWERARVPLEASPALRGHAIKALSLEQTSGSKAGKKVDWDYFRTQAIPPPNLGEDETFTWATVPVEGDLSVRHFLPREKLRECGVCVGEVYTTALDSQVSSACSVGLSLSCSHLPPQRITSSINSLIHMYDRADRWMDG